MGEEREKEVLLDWDSALGDRINSAMEHKAVAGSNQTICRF